MAGVLDGIRVLDFGRYIAGPFCGMLLGDMGAEVIRIDKLSGSEDRYLVPVAESGEGPLFLALNRNKKSLTLNPMKPQGREIVENLVKTADIVIANLPQPTLEAMGIDYDSLRAIKPDIILTTVTAYGNGGPYSERVGFDGVAQALAGATYMGGRPGDPMKSFVPFADFGTATMAAFGTLSALIERNKTGNGQLVEAALTRTVMAFNIALLAEEAIKSIDRPSYGNRGYSAGPSDIFKTTDGAVMVQVVGQPLFERWAKLMGEESWLQDPRFATDMDRGENGELLSARMQMWCKDMSTKEVLDALDEARIPCGPVLSAKQVLQDPHIKTMDFLQDMNFPGLNKPIPINTTPVKLSQTPGTIRQRTAELGEHTDEILNSLGYTTDKISEMRNARVV
uniref:Predicted acyl-CoA transferases/carnitine dehydratase n=1 Tax=uncultured alpha proteobacterium HF0130_20P23 TaxID=710809 RepID=E0XT92_9PROT|nr:predicted acyl-CoA transferases/carnitine dehydratase [uncultured alpha proteobacterium HF0130_20P23]